MTGEPLPATIREADLVAAFASLGIDLDKDTLSIVIDFASGDRPAIRIRRIALDDTGATMMPVAYPTSRGQSFCYLTYEHLIYWEGKHPADADTPDAP